MKRFTVTVKGKMSNIVPSAPGESSGSNGTLTKIKVTLKITG